MLPDFRRHLLQADHIGVCSLNLIKHGVEALLVNLFKPDVVGEHAHFRLASFRRESKVLHLWLRVLYSSEAFNFSN